MNNYSELVVEVFAHFKSHYKLESDIKSGDVAFVFGRKDPALASVASSLWHQNKVKNILVTGGIGKDSGDLTVPEAVYLADLLVHSGVSKDSILIEAKATNGSENSDLGIKMIQMQAIKHAEIILIGHPASLYRLYQCHKVKARNLAFKSDYQLLGINWSFDPSNIKHQTEVLEEALRVIKWPKVSPESGGPWADPHDLPEDLVVKVLAWEANRS